ncbi:MAG TPA: hypothetical protein VGI82_00835 [Chitinophagaceae bacterium]|jgi:hypothetical protein
MYSEKLSEQELIRQIHVEQDNYEKVIRDDKVFEEARRIKTRINYLKAELIKLSSEAKQRHTANSK